MDKETSDLYIAVANYVESIGGSAVVVGGVQVQHWPGAEFKFKLVVDCTGKRPTVGKDEVLERPSDG